MRLTHTLVFLVLIPGFVMAQSPAGKGTKAPVVYGYPGNGQGISRKSNPPTSCDEKTGKNIAWKIPMPNWGHSVPLVVKENVFVISEGGWPEKQDLPLMQCLDIKTGKELWRATLDHVPATSLSDAEKKEALDAWHQVMADFRTDYTIFNEYIYSKDPSGKEAAVAKFKALGRTYGGWRGGGYGQLRSLKPKCDEVKAKTAAKAGLTQATWQHGCGMGQSCFGQTFPTPVSDGENVYVVTAFGGFFCYGLDGKQKWVTYSPGKGGEYCRNGRSPLLYGDLLISDITAMVRGIDKKTGKVLWSHPVDEETFLSPVVISTGGSDVLLCFNKKAFKLPEGTPLTLDGNADFGALAVVNPDEPDVVFFSGGGEHGGWANKGKCDVPPPSAIKFSLSGTTLKQTVLWSGINGQGMSGHTGLVYCDGKLYHDDTGSTYDPKTGKLLSGTDDRKKARGQRVMPSSKHMFWVTKDHMYGLREGGGSEGKPPQSGILECYTLDGKKVGESTFANAPVEGDKKKQVVEQNGYDTWMFSYACPFTVAGDRILVRSYDYLWCIATK